MPSPSRQQRRRRERAARKAAKLAAPVSVACPGCGKPVECRETSPGAFQAVYFCRCPGSIDAEIACRTGRVVPRNVPILGSEPEPG